ncbi:MULTISPECIES: DUF4286 family protein [Weeksella]|uniref:DUF4286 domain-containing protein n=1 Tax=Weeksella virosa (strain ATCC 43766 / DSM 16922 / JCM 21250 / CCUG 30538 / CDC 9751 / IAM 14551 / NBRC 16016 / NCTC 11634 / CL345/78) TaxID=865938 RepID=F0P1T6_WEEVC|nr:MULTISPECIES: DUF4286 family protein [Weeksella]ADX68733.1 hypothetical protein Weevi_2059 [Weeksella virosa DSM 16922]MDK7375102.1 DUF4286 family protein [Weeksella virosa]MDK7675874.1 DUF4286 family protein [Weeksella virosa]OFM85362.1 hypothetical protein HMPREF2660_07330 [Weeksella sp. HMSC059D05]SUP55083.1 Uncharacterised protein [Weeksella virosa]
MIIYNTTFFVDAAVEEEWLEWFQNEQITNYLEKKHFSEGRFAKVTSHEQDGTVSYAMQLFCENQEKLMQFRKDILPYLQTESLKKFGTKVLSFETEMLHIKDFGSN